MIEAITMGAMLIPVSRAALLTTALAAFSGCASSSTLRESNFNAGTLAVFPFAGAAVVDAARTAMISSDLRITDTFETDERLTVLIGEADVSAFSWGEVVRVVVERTSPNQSTVRVVTKRKLATNITARGDYSADIFSKMWERLNFGRDYPQKGRGPPATGKSGVEP